MRQTALIAALALGIMTLVACAAVADTVTGDALRPLSITNATLGGGDLNTYTHGVAGGNGTNNIGLLVRTWGVVTHVDEIEQFFYIDDGGKVLDNSGFRGVRVSYKDLASGNVFTPPLLNQRVAVTGISSTTLNVGSVIATLRPRRQADMTPIP